MELKRKKMDKMFRFRLTEKEKNMLKAYSYKRGIAVSQFIRGLIIDFLQREEIKKFLEEK